MDVAFLCAGTEGNCHFSEHIKARDGFRNHSTSTSCIREGGRVGAGDGLVRFFHSDGYFTERNQKMALTYCDRGSCSRKECRLAKPTRFRSPNDLGLTRWAKYQSFVRFYTCQPCPANLNNDVKRSFISGLSDGGNKDEWAHSAYTIGRPPEESENFVPTRGVV
ncbi:hypothetical protein NL676_015164 [Syzygium grande]|nr:hypothetical protein NL676_015164 [Syzygium grande]